MAQGLSVDIERTFASGYVLRAALLLPAAREVTVLFGPSGSGKTTLLRCIAGLERPDSGTIRFEGATWFDGAKGAWCAAQGRGIGYVPQDDALFPHLSVRRNLEYPLNGEDRGARADQMLASLGLTEFADRRPAQLSGGQRQRVSLARALVTRPRLVLLDEPMSALDVPLRERVREDLRRLLAGLDAPTIVVTHDRADALALGDRIAVLIGGTIRQVGPVAEVFGRPSDPEVAKLLGVETVVEGDITGARDGLVTVRIGSVEVTAVSERTEGRVLVCLRGEDVVLQRGEGKGSARNHLAARVTFVRPEGPLVRIGLDCGFALTALVTRPSVEDLSLTEGATVTASIKAPAVHLIAR
jgi:molybdate transport system ATP-binding protein